MSQDSSSPSFEDAAEPDGLGGDSASPDNPPQVLKPNRTRTDTPTFGTAFDTWCMKRTLRRWQNKFPDFDTETFEIALRSRKYVSKHHPQQFQRRVLDALEERIQNFESQHGVTL